MQLPEMEWILESLVSLERFASLLSRGEELDFRLSWGPEESIFVQHGRGQKIGMGVLDAGDGLPKPCKSFAHTRQSRAHELAASLGSLKHPSDLVTRCRPLCIWADWR